MKSPGAHGELRGGQPRDEADLAAQRGHLAPAGRQDLPSRHRGQADRRQEREREHGVAGAPRQQRQGAQPRQADGEPGAAPGPGRHGAAVKR
jgi:hypothetical protein